MPDEPVAPPRYGSATCPECHGDAGKQVNPVTKIENGWPVTRKTWVRCPKCHGLGFLTQYVK